MGTRGLRSQVPPLPESLSCQVPTLAHMRFIHLYLIGYFVLVLGAVLALWKAGVLAHVSGTWIAIGMVIVLGLGIMLAVTSGKPTITNE
jgi:uncharacterized protein YjeT (DUF2065 family)